jgi:hypothetical protein
MCTKTIKYRNLINLYSVHIKNTRPYDVRIKFMTNLHTRYAYGTVTDQGP